MESQDNPCVLVFLSRSLGLSSISSPNMTAAGDDVSSSSSMEVREDVGSADNVPVPSAPLPQVPHDATPSYFLDYSDKTLHLYGWGALEGVEVCKPVHSKQDIQHLHFHCIEFEDIAQWLPKLLLICPTVTVSNIIILSMNVTGIPHCIYYLCCEQVSPTLGRCGWESS